VYWACNLQVLRILKRAYLFSHGCQSLV
jgi:hypothetical protein